MNTLAADIVRANGERIGAGKGAAVMEDPQTPGSDCNSNPATDSIQQDLVSSEFVQDNVEYQWFIDYGYRDGGLHIHPSILSSLSASYSPEDLCYYDDLSRNLDANLAEIDIESFRTADIHTLLTALPVMCTDPVQHSEFNYQRERYASISGSVMEKLDIGSSISPHTSSQGEDSACSTTDTISICKSSLLFSPLKETPVLPPTGSYSVDSLDCEDMLLTCQANNKNNYTIAFEGSITMYSDGSEDFGNQDKQKADGMPKVCYTKKPEVRNISDSSMVCSDSKVYTTWSNLKHTSTNKTISRHPSGNNNTIPNFLHGNAALPTIKRSQSLPDLTQAENSHVNVPLNFSVDSAESNHQPLLHLRSSGSVMSRSVNDDTSDGGASNSSSTKKLQNLSLVKLFMKQKSMSAEGMSLTLDQSDSISDNGWHTSNSDSATNMQTQRQYATGVRARPISEKDFSINWLQRDRCSNEDILKDEVPCNGENQRNMMSSASVEELSESTRDSDIEEIKIVDDDSRISYSEKKRPTSKTTATQAVIQTEDNEVQTSIVYTLPMDGLPPVREKILNERPVYVVYPNYTLPDLSFLNVKQHQSKWENVALKPQCYNVKRGCCKRNGKHGRPFSCNDIDALRQRGFSHVKDWESLTFLLPTEYKKILHDVPELSQHINVTEETKKPLFCLSPPMRHKARTTLVDVVANNASSSSSTATQPSSGYRGSSTILSDSSTNQQVLSNNVTNPLYLYRYDSISSEASLASNEKKAQRGGSGLSKIACPNLPKRSVSLPYREREPECCNGKVPPRPPLPRSILRKNKVPTTKRYSMFEMGGVEEVDDQPADSNKRMSLQEPYYMNNDLQLLCRGRIVDSEKDVDETEERCHVEVVNNSNVDCETSQHSEDDVKQLEEFLKRSGFSSQSSDGDNEDPDIKLRSYVRKFLALKMNKDMAKNIDMVESQKKTVSFAVRDKKKYVENDKRNHFNVTLNESAKDRADQNRGITVENKIDLEEKKSMISSASKAVDLLLKYWNAEATTGRQSYNDKHECAQLCLSNLCPALYAIMSDGLKPQLHSTFGPITNSVWQVVEASAQQGPLTKTLNELVQKINGEDVITEGMLKFHAFIFGLLNLRALDAWFAYLCTRESILRKHYNNDSLFIAALASANARKVIDTFLYNLNPLAFCPFQLDLLYQYRQLHSSFGNKNNHGITGFRNDGKTETATPNSRKVCPRSCGVYNDYQEKYSGAPTKADLENVLKKRFANIVGTKTLHTLEKLASEDSEDYTDSLEHSPSNRATTNKQLSHAKLHSSDVKFDEEEAISGEAKFRKLQEKWELMVGGKEDTKSQVTANTIVSPTRMLAGLGKSKIPRPLTSPVKQANLTTTNVSGSTKNAKSPVSGIPSLKKVAAITAAATVASSVVTPPVTPHSAKAVLKKTAETRRTSRVDQEAIGASRNHSTRPSSLPYKAYGLASKEKNLLSPHRRAASTSLPRPNTSANNLKATTGMKQTLKEVRTVMHRLPSSSGHLSFGEGERLKVILEIDNKWLLCARGDRKGLVPRMCVHSVQT